MSYVYSEVERTETRTLDRLNELMRLYALIVINMVGAGLAMSYRVATGVNNLIPIIPEKDYRIRKCLYLVPNHCSSSLSVTWILRCLQTLLQPFALLTSYRYLMGRILEARPLHPRLA